MPAVSTSWTCTKTSEPSPSGEIKPYPRSALKMGNLIAELAVLLFRDGRIPPWFLRDSIASHLKERLNLSFTVRSGTTSAAERTVTHSSSARSSDGQTHAFPPVTGELLGPGHFLAALLPRISYIQLQLGWTTHHGRSAARYGLEGRRTGRVISL
jgi:hypothetical protein